VAVVNAGFATIGARTADRLEGPWSEPVPWLDCTAMAQVAVPTCYSPAQHPELATDGGRALFVTFTQMATYDVVAYELRLGDPIHEYRGRDGTIACRRHRQREWEEGPSPSRLGHPSRLRAGLPLGAGYRGGVRAYAPEPGFTARDVVFYAAPTTTVSLGRPTVRYSSGGTGRRVLSPLEAAWRVCEHAGTRGVLYAVVPAAKGAEDEVVDCDGYMRRSARWNWAYQC
jgi:hypothetical protein